MRHWLAKICMLGLVPLVLAACAQAQPQAALDTTTAGPTATVLSESPCDVAPLAGEAVAIDDVEITQGLRHDGDLVPAHATAVIINVRALTETVSVIATLTICENGQVNEEERPEPISLTLGNTETIVFEPIWLWAAATNWRFVVELTAPGDKTRVLGRDIVDRQTGPNVAIPILIYAPIDFEPSEQGAPPQDLIAGGHGDAFVSAALPTGGYDYVGTDVFGGGGSEFSPIVIRADDCDETPACTYQIDHDKRLNLENPQEFNVVFRRLGLLRQRFTLSNGAGMDVGMNELLFIHGWVHDPNGQGVVEGNGAAIATGERVAYSTTSPDVGQLIYAHELVHNLIGPSGLGPDHVSPTPVADAVGWDVGQQLPGGWTNTGLVAGMQRKELYYPLMSHETTKDSWISPVEYAYAASYFADERLRNIPLCPEDLEIPEIGEPCLGFGHYVLSGALQSQGPFVPGRSDEWRVAAVYPIAVTEWPTQPTFTYSNYSKDLPFSLIFQNQDDTWREIPFDPRITTFAKYEEAKEKGGTDYLGYFEMVVPPAVLADVDRIDIRDNATGQTRSFLSPEDLKDSLDNLEFLEPLRLRS